MKHLHSLLKIGPVVLLLLLLASCTSQGEYKRSYSWAPVAVSQDIEEDQAIEAIIAPYRAELDSIMNEVIGYAAHDLTARGQYESNLGTFVTSLFLSQSISTFGKSVDVSVMNHHGGLRASLNEGPITLGEVFEVMPFENEMRLLEMTGTQLTEVIEYIGKSGRSMIWPVGFEVTDSGLKNIVVAGKAIVPEQTYIMAISDYLANGGGGFKMLTSLKRLDIEPIKQRDMIVDEIRQRTAQGDSIETEIANLITVAK